MEPQFLVRYHLQEKTLSSCDSDRWLVKTFSVEARTGIQYQDREIEAMMKSKEDLILLWSRDNTTGQPAAK